MEKAIKPLSDLIRECLSHGYSLGSQNLTSEQREEALDRAASMFLRQYDSDEPEGIYESDRCDKCPNGRYISLAARHMQV